MDIKVGGSQWEVYQPEPLSLGRSGGMGDIVPDVVQLSSSLSSSIMQTGTIPQFSAQWRSITSNRFVINMVRCHHLQLRSHPQLLCNFRWFNIQASPGHHYIIKKGVDELLAKGVIEPYSGGTGFTPTYSLFLSVQVA